MPNQQLVKPQKRNQRTQRKINRILLEKEYKPLIQKESLDYKQLGVVLNYLTTEIITAYENNIKQHYVEYVERYVNFVGKKRK